MRQTILLVEDDPAVARMLMMAMKLWGFTAVHAATPDEALRAAQVHRDSIGLLICDVVMPGKSGPAIAESIRAICPEITICFTSGYPLDVLSERGLLPAERVNQQSVVHLQKPFLPQTLHELITGLLQAPAPSSEPQARKKHLYASAY